ncbi:MAG: carboxymuconolactone decarboxylase family protein [Thermomicrobiales bacterium]|nr:carboxymuconolactone decarboxylase family protein [Thermomicrobiales bacterium]
MANDPLATVDRAREFTPRDDRVFDRLAVWDREWTRVYEAMATSPWTNGVLPVKTIELISLGLNAACTTLNAPGVRRHLCGALAAGATRGEILAVLKMSSLLAIHACSLAAPILVEEAHAAGAKSDRPDEHSATPACDAMRTLGQWNDAWRPFFELDRVWTDRFMAAAIGIYDGGDLGTKEVELLSIAFDASVSHMYAPGTRRHIAGALAAGATVDEIMEVLKLCVTFGGEALRLGVPILAEQLGHCDQG